MAEKKNKNSKALNSAITQELMSDAERVEFLLVSHWKGIVAALIALAAAVAVGFLGYSAYRSSRHKAASALADASTVEELRAALDAYGSAPGASAARFRLATQLAAEKKYADALAELEKVASDSSNPMFAAQAALTAAYLHETADDGKAVQAFADLGARPELPEQLRAEANFNAARIEAAAGRLTEAVDFLDRIPKAGDSRIAVWSQQGGALRIAVENGEYGSYSADGKSF